MTGRNIGKLCSKGKPCEHAKKTAFTGASIGLGSAPKPPPGNPGHFSVVPHSDGTTTITTDGTVISSLFGTLTIGRTVIELDANRAVSSSTSVGRQVDLCAELSGS